MRTRERREYERPRKNNSAWTRCSRRTSVRRDNANNFIPSEDESWRVMREEKGGECAERRAGIPVPQRNEERDREGGGVVANGHQEAWVRQEIKVLASARQR